MRIFLILPSSCKASLNYFRWLLTLPFRPPFLLGYRFNDSNMVSAFINNVTKKCDLLLLALASLPLGSCLRFGPLFTGGIIRQRYFIMRKE